MWASTEGVQVSGRAIAMVSETGSADKEPAESEIEPMPTSDATVHGHKNADVCTHKDAAHHRHTDARPGGYRGSHRDSRCR